ncbi:putative monooxygenase moxC [Burkholderia thailandensis USAMRU Malaysia |uniref:Nitrilotriacetate monooxygenase component A n=1 Tax=Burkholderia thailandensis (strain ATCC 700388 / DSM 13276 / CCUG 48851 / CIP 106301 / E264) TaxID=271848 RepID=Q2T2W7_BURTA|nr:LLM class flavin-dependent oxidoreductase [Burkholderia thailandensis]ABC36193.1 nitrilotriacetate monooxygenase component A [Burkholderia thailandensis E264]AHI76777.1 putative monooxygenase moxC [Burkholderia thailandensis 2002721723]AHI80823.1 putative monooxygenase moxC [Burkholderia thailandensis E444]AIC89735.1 putative monooxygenase moxC [Burkholderia thailandensis USAMRU Malaysia \
MTRKHIHFGVLIQGAGANMNAWKHPSVPPDASINFDFYVDRARRAENAGIAFAFIADSAYVTPKSAPHFLNRFEPISLLSALAALTSKIGLVGTMSSSYSEPYNVARQFASLDLISGGRAGWNVVTSSIEGTGKNYGRPHPDHAQRYAIAEEHLDVVQGLWDSWDDDALVRDRATGQFFDPDKLHRLDHRGRFFSVEGPLNIRRSPQGQPVIFQAGSSDDGIAFAGRCADAVFSNGSTFDEARVFYRRVKAAAAAAGRDPDHVKVFPGIGPIVGETQEDADGKYRQVRDLLSPREALAYLSHFFQQHDFSVYPLDGPFPDIGDLGNDGFQSTTDNIKRLARERKLTLREVAYEVSTRRSNIGTSEAFIGTPARVADEMIRWVDEGAADGFMLGLPVTGFGLDDFVDRVLPVLTARGYFDPVRRGATLRDHLGLPYKESRYAHDAQVAAI